MSSAATAEARSATTLVIGLGNPILGDDGVGWRIADALERRHLTGVEIDRVAVGGLGLMERLLGYERVVIADALVDGDKPPGSIWCGTLAEAAQRSASHLDSAHDTTLPRALALGGTLGAPLPEEILVVGVSVAADRVAEFGDELTPAIEAAVEPAADAILELLCTSSE